MDEIYYLNLIEQNTDNTTLNVSRVLAEMQNMKEIQRNTQQILISGDTIQQEQLNQVNNMLGLQALIIMAILLYLFIVRSLK